MQTRNFYFDQIKGILIILVIIGHVALGSMNENVFAISFISSICRYF